MVRARTTLTAEPSELVVVEAAVPHPLTGAPMLTLVRDLLDAPPR